MLTKIVSMSLMQQMALNSRDQPIIGLAYHRGRYLAICTLCVSVFYFTDDNQHS